MESAPTETSASFRYPAKSISAIKYQISKLQHHITNSLLIITIINKIIFIL